MNIDRVGGGALLVGFLTVLVVLFREPASGVDAATGGLASVVYFVVMPATGVVAGVYTLIGGPYAAMAQFLFGSYLGVVGLALTLGSVLAPDPAVVPLGVGVVLLALSLVAVLASLGASTSAIRLDVSRFSTD